MIIEKKIGNEKNAEGITELYHHFMVKEHKVN